MDERLPITPSEVRYELKLPFSAALLPQARSWIRMHPEAFRIAYPSRLVNNLYLDSPGLTDLAESLAGQAERRKLRLRWYGQIPESAVVKATVEMKIKRGSVGDKRRLVLPEPLDLKQPYAQLLTAVRAMATDEWLPRLQKSTQPALINRYRRDYFVSADGVIRCTLDYDQTYYDQRYSVRPDLTNTLTANALVVIEVKAPVKLAERLEQAMDFFPVRRLRHSKYVDGLLNGTF